MSKRTATNSPCSGLVERMAIPAELHEGPGGAFASCGSVWPIHRCSSEQISEMAPKTHHYCDIFSEQLLAPLAELAYVRIDDSTAEKVFVNRSKRLLLTSSDGVLAQWRCAPTFESSNSFLAGTPIVSAAGDLVSVVTAKRGNHYAVSNFEGDGGYFATPLPWRVLETPAGYSVYGERSFPSCALLREHIASLPPAPASPARAVLHVCGAAGGAGGAARIALVGAGGTQLSHAYVHAVLSDGIVYL